MIDRIVAKLSGAFSEQERSRLTLIYSAEEKTVAFKLDAIVEFCGTPEEAIAYLQTRKPAEFKPKRSRKKAEVLEGDRAADLDN